MTVCSDPPSRPPTRPRAGRRTTLRWLLLGVVVWLVGQPTAASADTDRWVWPLTPRPTVVRGFEPPDQPWGSGHRGVDLSGTAGDRVRASGDGVVSYAGLLAGRGVVAVQHGGLRTTYEPLEVEVDRGDRVRAGDPLGRLSATGSHCRPAACLHWGLRRGTAYLDPLSLVGAGRPRLLPTEDGRTGADSRAPAAAHGRSGGAGRQRADEQRAGDHRRTDDPTTDDRPGNPSGPPDQAPRQAAGGSGGSAEVDPHAGGEPSASADGNAANDRLDAGDGGTTLSGGGAGRTATLAAVGTLAGLIVGGVTVALRRRGPVPAAVPDASPPEPPPPHTPAPNLAAGVVPFPTRPRPPVRSTGHTQPDPSDVIDLANLQLHRRGPTETASAPTTNVVPLPTSPHEPPARPTDHTGRRPLRGIDRIKRRLRKPPLPKPRPNGPPPTNTTDVEPPTPRSARQTTNPTSTADVIDLANLRLHRIGPTETTSAPSTNIVSLPTSPHEPPAPTTDDAGRHPPRGIDRIRRRLSKLQLPKPRQTTDPSPTTSSTADVIDLAERRHRHSAA